MSSGDGRESEAVYETIAQYQYPSSSMMRRSGPWSPAGSDLPSSDPASLASAFTPQQYLARLCDLGQMDLQSAVDQMRTLLSLHPQRVYRMAYYRKQTKNHWARDDPAFPCLQVAMLGASSLAYGVAFRVASWSAIAGFVAKSVVLHWLGMGVAVASAGSWLANQHLMTTERSASHVKQNVEWLYAFDVHCNAFVPLFVLLCECVVLCPCIYIGNALGNAIAGYSFIAALTPAPPPIPMQMVSNSFSCR